MHSTHTRCSATIQVWVRKKNNHARPLRCSNAALVAKVAWISEVAICPVANIPVLGSVTSALTDPFSERSGRERMWLGSSSTDATSRGSIYLSNYEWLLQSGWRIKCCKTESEGTFGGFTTSLKTIWCVQSSSPWITAGLGQLLLKTCVASATACFNPRWQI